MSSSSKKLQVVCLFVCICLPIPEPILEEEAGKNRRGSGKGWVDIPNPHLNSIENIKYY